MILKMIRKLRIHKNYNKLISMKESISDFTNCNISENGYLDKFEYILSNNN